jgi:kynurenine formamidase
MIHDLSITLNEQTLPFLPAGDPHMIWKHSADHSFAPVQVSLFTMVTHLGTHIDAPLHYIKGGKAIPDMPLSAYCGRAVCIEAEGYSKEQEYDIGEVMNKNKGIIEPGDILLLHTGYEDLVGTPAYFEFADFRENTGEILEQYGINGIGFDLPSIAFKNRAHQEVLGRGIGIIESLINLKPLIGRRFYFSAAPLKFEDGDGSPVRAYAVTED